MRMRPLNKDEEEGETIIQKVSDDSLSINGQTFTFDSVADAQSTQARSLSIHISAILLDYFYDKLANFFSFFLHLCFHS